ncbi:MAG: nitroreductase family protein [Candidatus Pacearchaeota archaeon]|jgi:nitroreductase
MDLTKAIYKRRSVKKYSKKKPDWRDIVEAIDASRHAPMAGNNFSLKFIIIDDEEKIKKLASAAQQQFIQNAQYVVVACTNPSRTINAYEERGKIYCRQQAGAAIQNFLLKLEERKLATCWVGHFVEKLIKEAVGVPEDIDVEAIFPIGYEQGKTPKKSKTELRNILYFNKYGKKGMITPRQLEV